MADLEVIERTISGKGEIKIPIEYAKAKNIYLYTRVVRRVKTPSLNLTWNPDKGFYAHVSFCIDDYVLQTYDINFMEQVFYIYDGMSAQILVSLICGIREVLGTQPLISSHTHNIFQPNRIKFECFGTTALILTLKGEELDLCDPDDSKPNPPPNPPPKLPETPPDNSLLVDPPYEDDPNGDNTDPNEGDEFKENPGSGNCIQYNVRYSFDVFANGVFVDRQTNTINLWGPIGSITATRDVNNDPTILIECKGVIDFSQPCENFEERGVNTITGGADIEFTNPTIDEIIGGE